MHTFFAIALFVTCAGWLLARAYLGELLTTRFEKTPWALTYGYVVLFCVFMTGFLVTK